MCGDIEKVCTLRLKPHNNPCCFREERVFATVDSSFDQGQLIHNQELKIRAKIQAGNVIYELALNNIRIYKKKLTLKIKAQLSKYFFAKTDCGPKLNPTQLTNQIN